MAGTGEDARRGRRYERGIRNLKALYDSSPSIPIDGDSRILIISDLHMGAGGRNDDFARNSELLLGALAAHYAGRGFALILNGDVEELLRAKEEAVHRRWAGAFGLFYEFAGGAGLHWMRGNHDAAMGTRVEGHGERAVLEGLRLVHRDGTLFAFHGHQAGTINSGKYNRILSALLRVFANPFGFGNRSVAFDSEKRIKIERTVYGFSRREGIASVIGHTHRPLFESLSKREYLRYRIETLCDRYAGSRSAQKREAISGELEGLKREWREGESRVRGEGLADLVYDDLLVPCLFNSGCCIGKRGFTAIEIQGGSIALVLWRSRDQGGLSKPERIVLRRARLKRVFERIKLLR